MLAVGRGLGRGMERLSEAGSEVGKVLDVAGEAGWLGRAVAALRGGGVVAVPTDTVYGLATRLPCVGRLYEVKGRSGDKPIAVALRGLEEVDEVALVGEELRPVLAALLPGPRTAVLRRSPALCPALNPRTELVGVRVPERASVLGRLVEGLGEAVALTSANASGAPSSLAAEEFRELWPQLDVVLDAGRLPSDRAASTVLDLSRHPAFSVLRDGSALHETLDILQPFALRRV